MADQLVSARAAVGFYARSAISKGESFPHDLARIDENFNAAKSAYEAVCKRFEIPAYATYNED